MSLLISKRGISHHIFRALILLSNILHTVLTPDAAWALRRHWYACTSLVSRHLKLPLLVLCQLFPGTSTSQSSTSANGISPPNHSGWKTGHHSFESIPIPLPGTTLPPKHLIHPLSICIPPSLTQTPISHLDYLSSLPIVLPSTLTPSLTGVPFPAQSAFYNANLIILLLCLKPTKGDCP